MIAAVGYPISHKGRGLKFRWFDIQRMMEVCQSTVPELLPLLEGGGDATVACEVNASRSKIQSLGVEAPDAG